MGWNGTGIAEGGEPLWGFGLGFEVWVGWWLKIINRWMSGWVKRIFAQYVHFIFVKSFTFSFIYLSFMNKWMSQFILHPLFSIPLPISHSSSFISCSYLLNHFLIWIELTWLDLTWIGLNWRELTWIDLNWLELNWIDLIWIDLTWLDLTFELAWIELIEWMYSFEEVLICFVKYATKYEWMKWDNCRDLFFLRLMYIVGIVMNEWFMIWCINIIQGFPPQF